MQNPTAYSLPVNNGTLNKLTGFRELMEGFMVMRSFSVDELAGIVVKDRGIVGSLFQDRSVEGISKQENLEELIKVL